MRFIFLLFLFSIVFCCVLADDSDEKDKKKDKHDEEDEGEPEALKLDEKSVDEEEEDYYFVDPDAMIEKVTSAPTQKTEMPPNSLNTAQPSAPTTTEEPPLGLFGPGGLFSRGSEEKSETPTTTTSEPLVIGGQGMPCGNTMISNPVVEFWDRVLMFLSFPIVFCFIAATTEMFGTKS
ncbi:unnamed protein product [Caenorhabditis angaria]|uniref:Uncharacterized protein n=1 Tax=Caenorhabditis angaria TaxID=860376 RepID=A0A9P1IPQ3_9PELO|nr:unnamed protein product [Caenorhabditis angaria]